MKSEISQMVAQVDTEVLSKRKSKMGIMYLIYKIESKN